MARRVPALFVLVGLIPTPLGCSRADNAADRHAAEMREAIGRLEADADKFDQRLGNLEVATTEDRGNRAAEAAPKGSPAPPPRVLQLGASPDTGENDDPNAPEARPEIRLVGQPGYRPPRGGRSRVEAAPPSEPQPRTSALDPEAKSAYEHALSLVQGKHYAKGNDQLAAFLARWPDHPYAENAMYWRGEAFFGQGEYLRAAEQFEAVLARFGGG
jgi:TolA-binding protein